jgi:hypothetical protein
LVCSCSNHITWSQQMNRGWSRSCLYFTQTVLAFTRSRIVKARDRSRNSLPSGPREREPHVAPISGL